MKRLSKRILAVLLSAMTLMGACASLNAFAAEDDMQPVAATEAVESVAATDAIEEVTEPATEAPVVLGKVKGMKKISTAVNKIVFKWNATEGADGYVLYRSNADVDVDAYKLVAEVTGTTYTDTNLAQGTCYSYKLAPFALRNGEKVLGEFAVYNTATQPSKVSGISRVHTGGTTNDVAWNKHTKATGYKVFRALASNPSKYTLLKTINDANVTHYADTNVKSGTIYIYKVVTFRRLQNGNMYHGPGSVIKTMSGLTVADFTTLSRLYKVSLSWTKNSLATRYDVYCSKDKDAAAYTFLGSTTGTSFTHRFSSLDKYYFRVYPIYKTSSVTITGTSATKLVNVSSEMYGKATPNTYVEIDIPKQRMWFYKNGTLLVDTPVVTGNKGTADTPKGYFSVYSRARNTYLTGPGYSSFVQYWMAFSGGCGIHDASWRSTFGGNIYTYNGSHGCVNTPTAAVTKIYNNSAIGTPVIIY